MTTNAQTTRRPKQLRVFMPPSPADERKAFVDNACQLMSRSRCVPGCGGQLMIKFSDESEKHEAFYFVNAVARTAPSYPIANVVNCCSPIDIVAGDWAASRWSHDLPLASPASVGPKLAHGPPGSVGC